MIPDLHFAIIMAAGKWDLVKARLAQDARRWRTKGGITVHTELTSLTKAVLDKMIDTRFWDYFRVGQGGEAIAFDTTVWRILTGYAHKLSDLQYRQVSGRLFPKFYATVAELARILTGQRHVVIAIHMPTRNTTRRREVWDDCAAELKRWLPQLLDDLKPGDHLSVVWDTNVSWLTAAGQKILRALSNAPGLKGRVTWGWENHVDAADRKRALIDNLLTTLDVAGATLLAPVKSSDHQPIRFDCVMRTVVTAPTPSPTPVPTPTPDPVPTPAPTPPQEAPVARSQNGFSANDRSLWQSRQVPGTNVKLTVRKGPAGDLLIEAAVFWDRNIESIDTIRGGTPDDWGAAERPIRGSLLTLSNHASATAIDINALLHGLGRRGTFTARQIVTMHEMLDEIDHVLRWGEDYRIRKDGMHLELAKGVTDAQIRVAVQKLRQLNRDWQPGERDLAYREGGVMMFGDDVKRAQRAVGIGVADGYYGPVTAAKVKAWEKQRNASGHRPMLKVDGIVGTGTWRAMGVEPKYKG